MSAAEKEANEVKDILSNLTGLRFEITNAPDDFRSRFIHPEWFLSCLDSKEAKKFPYVNEAWKDQDGGLWLESLALGDTIDWIEVAYGEDAAANSIDLDYTNFASEKFQAEFGARYPLVRQRIQSYEEIAEGVSKVRKVHLEVRNSGSKGIVVFTLVAKLSMGTKSLDKRLEVSVAALREAYTQATQA
jgi:hypothetical protein